MRKSEREENERERDREEWERKRMKGREMEKSGRVREEKEIKGESQTVSNIFIRLSLEMCPKTRGCAA